jgi:hypothetical protein
VAPLTNFCYQKNKANEDAPSLAFMLFLRQNLSLNERKQNETGF